MNEDVIPVRHGDVFLNPTAEPRPAGAKEDPARILAVGEATGHAHRLCGDATLWSLPDGSVRVETGEGRAFLDHEDHGKPTLDSGAAFDVVLQEEYDPETGRRRVMD